MHGQLTHPFMKTQSIAMTIHELYIRETADFSSIALDFLVS